MKKAKIIALTAGLSFIGLAILIQGIIPALMKETGIKYVSKTIRTELGELKEIMADAVPYTELQLKGRQLYIREGCWYCHSTYVRPVTGEERRWGPVSQVGEYAYDVPHTFGTRRIGPDLTRDGGKYGDDWHRAHFFDARLMVPDSIMPKFTWLFEQEDESFVPNGDGKAIIAFVQKLGMNRGKWRDDYTYQIITSGVSFLQGKGSVEHGKEVYERRCVGCHGEKGDGKGDAATFFVKVLPRDFTSGTFKFRTTPSGSLPLDSDIFRTITIGVRGTAMPPWFDLPENERWDVVQYIKTFSPDFEEYPPDPPVLVPAAPKPDEALLAHGADLFEKMQCWQCHGKEGKGDGPASGSLTDDWGNKIVMPDFTQGIFKVGPRPEDIYRTFMTGLNGTPMPSFSSILTTDEDRWALSYFVLSLSADEK